MYAIPARWRARSVVFAIALTFGLGYVLIGNAGDTTPNKPKGQPSKTWEFAAFEERLLKHQNLTYDGLTEKLLAKSRQYVEKLPFDPTQAEYFDRVSTKLAMTQAETDRFKQTGFVSLALNARHSMVSAYDHIFQKDLPVLVTTDSILHALHRSFDAILMEIEKERFYQSLNAILDSTRQQLKKSLDGNPPASLADSYGDVDVYLTVAQNLLYGGGMKDAHSGKLFVKSHTGNDAEALRLLRGVEQLQMTKTNIYSGERTVDFSQFVPRGHYTKDEVLKRYFRAMMWFGRADTGWIILPPDPVSQIRCDDKRELRNAMLLTHLLDQSGALAQLKQLDDAINFMIGRSDNLSVFQLCDLMREQKIATLADIGSADNVERMQQALRTGKHHRPLIVSLVLCSDNSPAPQVAAPAQFQMFGQRFAMDSFVLSQVVFDTIVFEGRKMERRMPTGLDAMVALGNNEAIPLLRDELEKWKYSANLLACREFVDGAAPAFWTDSLYNIWLDSLRTFNADRTRQQHFPHVMKTQAWQRKELQTQLASWAELRHDTVLYVKQSYGRASCEYPAGYVEPYPEFYAKVKVFADKAATLFGDEPGKRSYAWFFKNFAETMAKLEGLAHKELKAQPFTKEEQEYVKKVLFNTPNCDGTPIYNGWYCQLHYDREGFDKWEPTITDVHTDPMTRQCLQVSIGETNLCVIAIDNEQHRRVYVGPIYSYYEFAHPLTDRMTDETWKTKLEENRTPPRPDWIQAFQAGQRPAAPAMKGLQEAR